jgi:predicted ATPase
MQQKIVIIGGPGTGKSTVLNELISRGFHCKPEISREVIIKAQKKGIDQLFLTDPLLFSKLLLEGREQQYIEANECKDEIVFFDRGIPDAHAYMNYSKT